MSDVVILLKKGINLLQSKIRSHLISDGHPSNFRWSSIQF